MIASLEGELGAIEETGIVLALGGLGLRVRVPTRSLANLGPVGSRVRLHTYLLVRENELALFGFEEATERSLFETLLGVSGVGPRVALGLLSHLRVDQLAGAIAGGDTDALSRVPGVGKKLAQRLALELKSKVEWLAPSEVPLVAEDETLAALQALGYSRQEAQEALRRLPQEAEGVEVRLRLALQQLARL